MILFCLSYALKSIKVHHFTEHTFIEMLVIHSLVL